MSYDDHIYNEPPENFEREVPHPFITDECFDDECEIFARETFTATLEYGNRKGLDFTDVKTFNTKEKAVAWLGGAAKIALCPSGFVTDGFGAIVYELEEEFYQMWAA